MLVSSVSRLLEGPPLCSGRGGCGPDTGILNPRGICSLRRELVYTVRWCSLANLPRAWLQQRNQAIVSHVGLSVGEGSVIGFVGSWMVMALLASCWGCSGHPRPLHASKDVLGRTCVLLGIYL